MGGQKDWSAINDVAKLVHRVQEKWSEKKIADALIMDVKEAFDYISRSQL